LPEERGYLHRPIDIERFKTESVQAEPDDVQSRRSRGRPAISAGLLPCGVLPRVNSSFRMWHCVRTVQPAVPEASTGSEHPRVAARDASTVAGLRRCFEEGCLKPRRWPIVRTAARSEAPSDRARHVGWRAFERARLLPKASARLGVEALRPPRRARVFSTAGSDGGGRLVKCANI
jgi:hypothetical protein